MKVRIHYKSGNTTELETKLSAEEIGKRIQKKELDINADTLTLINWGEVEAITNI